MLYSVLAVGDVVGEAGLAHLERHLRPLQKLKNISFTVVNGENISGVGLTCKQAWRVYDAGADAVTLGNHTFGKMEIGRMLDETPPKQASFLFSTCDLLPDVLDSNSI